MSAELGAVGTNSVAVGTGAPRLPVRAPAASPRDALSRYAEALAHYRRALLPTAPDLDRLSAPPMLRPDLWAERRAVNRSMQLSAEIERALRRNDIPAANAGIRALYGVAAELKSIRIQKAEAAAVHAYNARLAEVSILARKVADERQRLVRTVG